MGAGDVEVTSEGQRDRWFANDDRVRRNANSQQEEGSERCSREHGSS